MDVLQMMMKQLQSGDILETLGAKAGVSAGQAKGIVQMGIPKILGQLKGNSASGDAEALKTVLQAHGSDSIEDVGGFLKNVNLSEGSKMLTHIFKGNEPSIMAEIASQSGTNPNQVSGVLSRVAPLLMGVMGKQFHKGDMSVSALFGDAMSTMGSLTKMLDADGDGDVLDDVGKTIGGFFKK